VKYLSLERIGQGKTKAKDMRGKIFLARGISGVNRNELGGFSEGSGAVIRDLIHYSAMIKINIHRLMLYCQRRRSSKICCSIANFGEKKRVKGGRKKYNLLFIK